MAKAKPKSVIVNVDDQGRQDIQNVAAQLAAKGMTIEHVLANTGVITGTCPANKFNNLKSVAGIQHVGEDPIMTIPPGDAPQ